MSVQRTKVAPGIWKRQSADGKTTRFEVTYRDSDGRQRRQVVEGGKTAAEQALRKVKVRMDDGERVVPNSRLTFGEASDRWMVSVSAAQRPATVATYRTALTVHLLPAFGRKRLDKIDLDAIASLVERMQTAEYRREVERRLGRPTTESNGYAPWSIRGVLVVASRIFEHAHRRLDWAGTNPIRELERNEKPKLRDKERRILNRDELSSLIDAARSPYREVIATAAGLGTRLGETLGLTWADIDFGEGTISVRYQFDRRGQRTELKTRRSRRVIEAPGSLLSLLRAHKLASPHSKPGDLVFTTRTGHGLDHREVTRALASAAKSAEIDADGQRACTFHELRHAHASMWIASGGDLVELSARLGHSNPAITAAIYSHEFEAAARSTERRARLDAMYGADPAAAEPHKLRAIGE